MPLDDGCGQAYCLRLLLLVVLEIGTDWIKFCLITKFSEMQAKTFEAIQGLCVA